jgi:hypothetical protein
MPLLSHPRFAHTMKYIVYGSLVINMGFYMRDDYLAMMSALPADATWLDILIQFTTSVDTVAWLGLVFLFELETYAVPNEKWTVKLADVIRGLRLVCYLMIGYAAYGYTAETLENYNVTRIEGLTDVCDIADQGISIQIASIEYIEITGDNCAGLSGADAFYRIGTDVSIIDEATLGHVQWLGWIDVDNACVWLLVVFLIEIEVWLQSKDRFFSRALHVVRPLKTLGYLALIANMFVWWFTGYALYAWDAFLWLFGFWAIELNLAEWEVDRLDELAHA